MNITKAGRAARREDVLHAGEPARDYHPAEERGADGGGEPMTGAWRRTSALSAIAIA